MSLRNLKFLMFGALAPAILFLAGSTLYCQGGLTPFSGVSLILAAASLYTAWLLVRSVIIPIESLSAKLSRDSALDGDGLWKGPLPHELEVITGHLEKASRSMSERMDQHRDLLKNMPDLLIEMDADGKIRYLNDAACVITGYSKLDVTGRHFLEFVPKEWRGQANRVFSTLMEGKPIKDFELPLVFKDGRLNYFEFNSVPLSVNGRISGCCCIGRDMDERKKIMDELERARANAEETSEKLKSTISDLEEFALLAVRRELKMQELRERFLKLKEDHEIKREFPN